MKKIQNEKNQEQLILERNKVIDTTIEATNNRAIKNKMKKFARKTQKVEWKVNISKEKLVKKKINNKKRKKRETERW